MDISTVMDGGKGEWIITFYYVLFILEFRLH